MKLIRGINKVVDKICIGLIIVIAVLTLIQVVSRYIFSTAFFWLEEVVIYAMVWMVFLGATMGVIMNVHSKIVYFVGLLPVKLQRWIEILNDIICLAFCSWVTIYSLNVVSMAFRRTSTGSSIPMGFIYGSVTVGCAIMALYFVVNLYLRVTQNKTIYLDRI